VIVGVLCLRTETFRRSSQNKLGGFTVGVPKGVLGLVPVPPGGTSKKVVLRSGVRFGGCVPPGTTPGTPSGTPAVNPPIFRTLRLRDSAMYVSQYPVTRSRGCSRSGRLALPHGMIVTKEGFYQWANLSDGTCLSTIFLTW
jgi:hypothetical protein